MPKLYKFLKYEDSQNCKFEKGDVIIFSDSDYVSDGSFLHGHSENIIPPRFLTFPEFDLDYFKYIYNHSDKLSNNWINFDLTKIKLSEVKKCKPLDLIFLDDRVQVLEHVNILYYATFIDHNDQIHYVISEADFSNNNKYSYLNLLFSRDNYIRIIDNPKSSIFFPIQGFNKN